MGLGMEWRGLVVGGNQISDVELEGEEELRKKREKRGRQWGNAIWVGLGLAGRHDMGGGATQSGQRWGRHDLGWPWLGWAAGAWCRTVG